MPTVLVTTDDHIGLPHLLLVIAELLLFLGMFAWICLESVTFFTLLSIGTYFFGCIVLMVASRRGHFNYAVDIVAIFLSMLLAYPVAALEVQRRYMATSSAVQTVFQGCVHYRQSNSRWPDKLDSLVPIHLSELPRDSWGNELSYSQVNEERAPFVGFGRKVGRVHYNWVYDGRVWCSSWGAMSANAPQPPLFVFHY